MYPIQQRYNECYLASLCIYAGKTQEEYEKISNFLRVRYGQDGWATHRHARVQMVHEMHAEGILETDVPIGIGSQPVSRVGLHGKGILAVWWEVEEGTQGHCMYFEDSHICDPNIPYRKYTFSEWIADHSEKYHKTIKGFQILHRKETK